MRLMDGIIILTVLLVTLLGYIISKMLGVRRSTFIKTSGRKNIKALEILEEAGYRYLGGAGQKSVIQTINQKQYPRDVRFDFLVARGLKRYVVLIAKSEKEKLHIVETREKLMLISESFPADGILYIVVSSAKIIPIEQKWTRHRDYRLLSKEKVYCVLIFLAGFSMAVLWGKVRGL